MWMREEKLYVVLQIDHENQHSSMSRVALMCCVYGPALLSQSTLIQFGWYISQCYKDTYEYSESVYNSIHIMSGNILTYHASVLGIVSFELLHHYFDYNYASLILTLLRATFFPLRTSVCRPSSRLNLFLSTTLSPKL